MHYPAIPSLLSFLSCTPDLPGLVKRVDDIEVKHANVYETEDAPSFLFPVWK